MSLYRGLVVAALFSWCIGGAPLGLRGEPERRPHRLLGSEKGQLAIVEPDGQVSWKLAIRGVPHDVALLPNGNVLVIDGPATVLEVNRAKEIVWSYTSKPRPPYEGRVE